MSIGVTGDYWLGVGRGGGGGLLTITGRIFVFKAVQKSARIAKHGGEREMSAQAQRIWSRIWMRESRIECLANGK